jgi:hypothetical protein
VDAALKETSRVTKGEIEGSAPAKPSSAAKRKTGKH